MSALLAVLMALPLAYAAGNMQKEGKAAAGSTAPAPRIEPARTQNPSFEEADRNKDGFVDKSEAGAVPGLSANFEKADRNRDGKLDKDEYAQALERLDVGAK